MRLGILLLCAALVACGPAKTPATPEAADAISLAVDPAALDGRVIAAGADPNWRFDADRQIGVVMVMIDQDQTYSGDYAPPHRTETGFQIISGEVTLDLELEPCVLDGATFPMRATALARGRQPVSGCAFVRWDQRLMQLLPQIDACIALSPATRRVTYAAPIEPSTVLVRLLGEQGAVDCRAPIQASAGAARIGPSDNALRIGGDGAAIFVRAQTSGPPGENPGGQCYEAPEVHASDGTLLGWMDDPEGC